MPPKKTKTQKTKTSTTKKRSKPKAKDPSLTIDTASLDDSSVIVEHSDELQLDPIEMEVESIIEPPPFADQHSTSSPPSASDFSPSPTPVPSSKPEPPPAPTPSPAPFSSGTYQRGVDVPVKPSFNFPPVYGFYVLCAVVILIGYFVWRDLKYAEIRKYEADKRYRIEQAKLNAAAEQLKEYKIAKEAEWIQGLIDKQDNKEKLDTCIAEKNELYVQEWEEECKYRKLKHNCRLPLELADLKDNRNQKALEECYTKYAPDKSH